MPQFNSVDKLDNDSKGNVANLINLLEKEVDNPGAQNVCEHYNNGQKCDAWICEPFSVTDFDKKLSEAGISHACVQFIENNENNKGSIFIITKDIDREKAEKIRNEYIKELGVISKVSLEQLKRENVNDSIHTISGVSTTYATIFQEEAKKANMHIAVSDNKDGTFNVHYSSKDENKAKPVLMKTIESTKGVTGRLNEQRILQEAAERKELYDGITNPQKDFYIVSPTQPNEYMHFTTEGYQHYRNERLIDDELRSNKNYQQDAHLKIDKAFVKPVLVSREEFEKIRELPRDEYKKETEKIRNKKTKTMYVSEKDLHKLELERAARQLVELKMSMDNNPINNDFYNSSVSFNAFFNQEIVTDKQIDREEEMTISNPKSLPPDVEITIDKCDNLPPEDQAYIKENIKEIYEEYKDVTIQTEIITREELHEDLDAVIEALRDDNASGTWQTTTEITEEEREY